jgi:TolA-binding protein
MHSLLKINDVIQTTTRKRRVLKSEAFLIISACFLIIPAVSFGQQTAIYADPSYQYKQAQELYQQGLYAEAQPMFRQTIHEIGYFQETNRQLVLQNAQYYFNMCALQLDQPDAVDLSKKYIREVDNNPRKQLTAYYLAKYYFRHNQLEEAIPYYEQAGFNNLSNNDIAEAKFELGYCYFNMKEFNKAQPLFNAIKDVHNQYYIPANYYYGFIAYYNKNYPDALQSFQRVVNEPKYNLIVPYYIAEIYYYQDKPDKVISYAQPYLASGNLYYNNDLKHLVGQTYFEQKEYSKALPYLEEYEAGAGTLTKEDVYELAYCYYQENNLSKAIAGFKQLSGTEDSLGQNSMYLLGDCYLRTGQKAEARNAFAFCARSNYNPKQQEISRFNYGKLSYELGYQDAALNTLKQFTTEYPNSGYSTEAQELLAHLFMNTNDYKNALDAISSVPKTSPDAQRAYQRITFGRAVQLINDGDLNQAGDLLNKSLQYPVDPQMQQLAYFWKGEIALRQGNPDEAVVSTNQYLALGGNTPAALGEANVQTAHYNLGYSYLKRKEYENALQQFQLAQHVFGANGMQIANDATLRTADCYYMLKNYTDAQSLYNKAIASGQPGSDYALYQKGIIAGVTGNAGQKLSLLQQLSSQYPRSSYNSEADYQIAITYMTNEQYNQAIPYLQKVINNPDDPNAPKALLKLGLADFNLNNQQGAISSYQKVVTQYPNSSQANDALQSLRTLYVNSGQPDAYLNFLKSTGHTVTISAEDSITYAAGESSFGNNQYASAITQLNNYLSKFPSGQFVLPAHFYLAESYFNQKDYANALTHYAFVLSQSTSLYSERSASQASWISFYQNKNYQQALGYFTQLKQLSTSKENTLTALRGILRCNYELSQWSQISASAQNLLQTPGISTDDQIVGYFYLARAQQQQNEYDSAIVNYKTVAQMTKSELGAESRFFISQCYFAQNDLNNASNAAYDVIKNTPSYDYWVASAYIMLGNIFWKQNDYFNAKATLQSIVDNCKIPELVTQASDTLAKVKADERAHSKIRNANEQNQ